MRARPLTTVLICALVLTALSGCAGWPILSFGGAEAAPEPALAPVERRLTEAALRAETALTALARVRAAENPLDPPAVPRMVPPALLRPVTLDWTGPLETLAATLAGEAGYVFNVAGRRPVRPLMVDVTVAERPLILVLRDVGILAGAKATLAVDAERRRIELVWAASARPAVVEKAL